MARIVLTDVGVVIGSTDLSDHIASVTINQNVDEVETTAFGDGGRTRVGGLEDSSITLDFHQDFAAGEVDATIAPLVGGTAAFEISPFGTAVAASGTAPRYSGTVLQTEWTPLDGTVGDLSTASVTWPVSGVIARGTGA
ncbi:MAG TPA: radical SAM protein [Acidimicrobiia bacterium]